MLKITLEIFMRSTTKANAYNQTTDTFFIFGDDSTKVTLIWLFNYNNQDMNQYMECSYTMDGTNLTINSLVGVDSSNQWTWSTKTYYNLQSCSIDDLPFYPYWFYLLEISYIYKLRRIALACPYFYYIRKVILWKNTMKLKK